MMYKLFVVFSFLAVEDMERFKKTKNMDYVAKRKVAAMEVGKTYSGEEVAELFDNPFPCFIIYELGEGVEELVDGENLQNTDAS